MLGSQFGLTDEADQIRAVVTGEERGPDGETVLASGQGAEVEFQFDIGASFGLNVSARALTVSDEDVAALLGSLDASVGEGAKLLTTITLDSQDVSLGRMTTIDDPSTFTAIDPTVGYVVTVDGVEHTVPVTRVSNDDGTLTFTLKADSDRDRRGLPRGDRSITDNGTLQGDRHRQRVVRRDPRDYQRRRCYLGDPARVRGEGAADGPLRPGTRRRQCL